MADVPDRSYPDLPDDQMLAIGIYGEDVAAYRYTVLSERVPADADRRAFAAIAREEQKHRQLLRDMREKHFPDSSFALRDEDKALVLTGRRLIDVRGIEDFREVMRIALETELRTSQFYQAMSGRVRHPEIRTLFETLATEGFEHHRILFELARERNFLPEKE